MCNIFLNKIYNTYRDLHTRIILNNVLKVTLYIVENVFSPERAAARASTMNLYIIFVLQAQKLYMCYWKTELGESYQDLLEFYSTL